MKKNNIISKVIGFFIPSLLLSALVLNVSCSDEPMEDNYYSFTGKMMSQYLTENEDFSEFAQIVTVAGLMDQLATYGNYTCFAPKNSAVDAYLAEKGITFEQLLADVSRCDTIARTHLVNVGYTVSEMNGDILPTQNMMRRNLQISRDIDENNHSVVIVNNKAKVYFESQDDSVENGFMQPVDAVIENTTKSMTSIIKANSELSVFFSALEATKLADRLDTMVEDRNYIENVLPEVVKTLTEGKYYSYTTGAEGEEHAIPPAEKKYGFTAFVVPDKVLKDKYGITDLNGLYAKAKEIYGETPAGAEEYTNENNPLYKLMAYHLLDRNVQGYSTLTVRDDAGVVKSISNTTDWYPTMLPHSMIKVERLNVAKWVGALGILGDRYINRRYDDTHTIEGVHVQPTEGASHEFAGLNGIYFYIDDLLKYDDEVRNVVQNCRIRIDFSSLFPEIMTNSMRMNGDYTKYERKFEESKIAGCGYNYVFSQGYLDGVKIRGGNFVYRRPRLNFYSMHGDEMVANKVFDIEFRIPPVPFESEWQIRLGFAPMSNAPRGTVLIYFDGKATGIPLNMEEEINTMAVYGKDKSEFPNYNDEFRQDVEKRQEDFKILKNKGFYRGPWSIFHASTNNENSGERFAHCPSTVRRVLCTVSITPGETHTLRIKNVSVQNAVNKEAMLDYLELVPKSVYGVTEGDGVEDDL